MESLDDDLAPPQLLSHANDYAVDCTSSPHSARHPGPATSSGNQPHHTSDDALQEHLLAFHSLIETMSSKTLRNKKFIGKYDFLFFILLVTIFQLDCSCSAITFGQNI
jgi:hypothetical protein